MIHDVGRRDRVVPAAACGLAVGVPFALTWMLLRLGGAVNPADASLAYLILTLVFAVALGFWPAVAASLTATLLYNFNFLPPVGTLTISDPANWIALFAFLVTASVASRLVAEARRRSVEAEQRAAEATRLYELSCRLLSVTRSEDALGGVLSPVAEILGTARVHLAWLDRDRLRLQPDPSWPDSLSAWIRSVVEQEPGSGAGIAHLQEHDDRLIALSVPRLKPRRALVARYGPGGAIPPASTLEALASLIALALERAELIEASLASEVLRESEALKSALLASVSHDIRTPLSAAQLASTALQDPGVWDDVAERGELLATVEDAMVRLNRTVGNLLYMTRVEAGLLRLERRATTAAEVVQAAIEMTGPRRLGARLRIDLAADTPPLDCDLGLVATALSNLLDNTLKYAPDGSPVQVSARAVDGGGRVRLSVCDRGCGLAWGEEQLVFEPFRRGSRHGRDVSGIGLGLSIVRALVQAHGGEVELRPRPGGGTEAVVVLPAATKPALREQGGAPACLNGSSS